MKLSKLKRFLPFFIIIVLITAIGGGVYTYYSDQKKKQAEIARKTRLQTEKELKDSKEKFQKEGNSIKPWYTYHGIAHALGGIDDKYYLNSMDTFYDNYKNGYRIFEMDLRLTTDDILVGRHKWGKDLSDPLSRKGTVVSYRTFKKAKLYDRYTPTSFLDMLNLMEKYPDFYLMTDSKYKSKKNVKKQFSILVQTAKKAGKEKYLDRLIIQVYSQKMFYTVKKIYPFKHFLYTTYQQPSSAFYRSVNFCRKNGIEGLTSPEYDINDYRMEYAKARGVYPFTHTVNYTYYAKEDLKLGVYGIYSDFLTPTQINDSYLTVNCPSFAFNYIKTIAPGVYQ